MWLIYNFTLISILYNKKKCLYDVKFVFENSIFCRMEGIQFGHMIQEQDGVTASQSQHGLSFQNLETQILLWYFLLTYYLKSKG